MCYCRSHANSIVRNMDGLKKKLTRSLSGPKRCGDCRKLVYFSLNKCNECGNFIHKHCTNHANRHHSSHTTSLLAEHCIHHTEGTKCSKRHHKEHVSKTSSGESDESRHLAQSPQSPNAAMTGFLKIIRWLSHKRKAKERHCKAMANEKHVKGRFSLNPKLDNKEARKKLKALLKSTQNYQWQMYGDLYGQQQPHVQNRQRCSVRYFGSTTGCSTMVVERQRHRSLGFSSDSNPLLSPRSSLSSFGQFSSPFSTPKSQQSGLQYGKKSEALEKKNNNFEIEQKDWFQTGTSDSNANNAFDFLERQSWGIGTQSSGIGLTCSNFDATIGTFGKKAPIITKAKTLSIESRGVSNESLCATWPPVGKAGTTIVEETCDDSDYSEDEISSYSVRYCQNEERLHEWSIPFSDIEFKEKLRNGRYGDIYRGRWYGEVLIYTFQQNNDAQRRQFLEDVAQMGMIRHENIVLFMGACIEPQCLAVITSMRKGPTLYEYLHLRRNKLPFHSKLNIAKQIAQGMGYLHAKGITHKNLKSKNIILESRVKLCMMDHGMADRHRDRIDLGCIPRGHLSYLSPELMKNIQIDPPQIFSTSLCTHQSDIYAFGSLLFELMTERFLYQGCHPHSIIWRVAAGKQYNLQNFQFINSLKVLITKCWSHNSNNRPPFSEIVNELHTNATYQKRHSSSVPDKLHHMGRSGKHICT